MMEIVDLTIAEKTIAKNRGGAFDISTPGCGWSRGHYWWSGVSIVRTPFGLAIVEISARHTVALVSPIPPWFRTAAYELAGRTGLPMLIERADRGVELVSTAEYKLTYEAFVRACEREWR